jgi:hypothetical protein
MDKDTLPLIINFPFFLASMQKKFQAAGFLKPDVTFGM